MEINKIYNGNALEVLRSFPSNSVDMIMTSPPYWSLRDYAEGQFIWDNDLCNCGHHIQDHSHPNPEETRCCIEGCNCKEFDECDHEWGKTISYAKRDDRSPEQKIQQGATVGTSINSENFAKGNSGNYCQKCGAWKGQLGLEPNFELYIKHLCDIFDEVKRVLKKTGTCWVNLGDTYYGGGTGQDKSMSCGKYVKDGFKSIANALNARDKNYDYPKKSLCLVPYRFAIEMINRKWVLRNNLIWHKPNAMPTSVKDRFTVDFEDIFMFSKSGNYYFKQQFEPHTSLDDYERRNVKIKKGNIDHPRSDLYADDNGNFRDRIEFYGKNGRNKRTVWTITTKGFPEAHFAVYPEELLEIPIKAGCPEGGIILDPFFGAGTTGLVAIKNNCKFIGIEPNESYIQIADRRLKPYLTQTKLNDDGGTNFTKSSADDFPYQESLTSANIKLNSEGRLNGKRTNKK